MTRKGIYVCCISLKHICYKHVKATVDSIFRYKSQPKGKDQQDQLCLADEIIKVVIRRGTVLSVLSLL